MFFFCVDNVNVILGNGVKSLSFTTTYICLNLLEPIHNISIPYLVYTLYYILLSRYETHPNPLIITFRVRFGRQRTQSSATYESRVGSQPLLSTAINFTLRRDLSHTDFRALYMVSMWKGKHTGSST